MITRTQGSRKLLLRWIGMAASCSMLMIGTAETHAGTISGKTSVSSSQYALENQLTPRWDFDFDWRAGDSSLPSRTEDSGEVRVIGFAEVGRGGDWTLDLDPIVYRYKPSNDAGPQLWLGRQHPFSQNLRSSGAIGASWRQNQTDALSPLVSGWVGAGARYRLGSGSRISVAYSPLFLPNFGPALKLSEDQDAHGSRFARLPPSYVRINQAILPLRYQVNVGDLKDILLQNSFFASIDQESDGIQSAFMAWTSPAPSPEIDASAALRINDTDANVLVTAKPKFYREYFLGAKADWTDTPFNPEVEATIELSRPRLTMSWSAELFRDLRAGVLHTFISASAKTQSSTPDSPTYSNQLVWIDGTARLSDRLAAKLRLERHFEPGRSGMWTRPSFELEPMRRLKLFAQLSVLTGDDFGWFGTWRSLDSFSLGARYTW